MSIASTIKKMRDNEIMADLPKMSVNDLMAKRAELKQVLYNRQSNPDANKQEMANISIAITRELTARAEAQQIKDGDDPTAKQAKALQIAKEQRQEQSLLNAKRKKAIAIDQFDSLPADQKLTFLEDYKNPHEKSLADYGHTE